ncbi:iron chelate uptake ABC transporter family permease subunit [Corynebacterium sp.]|uniref:iron chelate uptake ABC transporter family permease subunit n=1 Tax=Corynebacterium sp. TaxID=1720 RepID=UPI0026DC1116|nr:iron chelate uptake ABC transporter family permease subunit [Corynebacterium sp.]MDO4610074.1 iron chelate uptake ABC transporter family permease subunit [Corynebacterium sp.]
MSSTSARIGVLVALAAGLAGALALSMLVGARPLSPAETWAALSGEGPADVIDVVEHSRVPRTLLLLAAGAALGVAGALMQTITRNPMADPGILGVNAGAGFAVVIALTFLGMRDITSYLYPAFIGALATSAAVFAVGGTGRMKGDPVRLTLAGVALGAVLSGLTSGMLLTDPELYGRMRSWTVGTSASVPVESTLVLLPFIAAGLLLAFASYRSLDVLALGDAAAVALGARPTRIRVVCLVAISLLAGAATAAAGPIGFIGLLTAHLARAAAGASQGWILAYAVVAAPLILAVSDVIGRVVVPGELPVGIVTSFVGAPMLIWVVRRFRMGAK